ncbi:CpsD/CapB family tyrosine-protein kinase [uncultured Tessaracoccus sp.]|uniref:CpsD/CapB family tyrosine-protein kinase n=1 Tax=uncultured Tessaracoccus sp. TaxID=905023 RepID=UPI002620BE6A|nr:CpsD/CapB family tyrosine-protein kinase [uncultured Tessaracoccus sp.]
MTVIDVVRLLRKQWLLILVAGAMGVAGAAGWLFLQPVVYEARATGYLIAAVPSGGSAYDAQATTTFAAQRVQQYMPLIETKAVADEMAKVLQERSPGVTPAKISAEIVAGSNILEVRSPGRNPAEAQARANAALQAIANVIHRMETIQPSAAKANEVGSLDGLPQDGQPSVALVNFEPANLPTTPVSPNWQRGLLLGAGLGLLVGALVAVLRRTLDARVRTSKEVEEYAKTSVLGVIPQTGELKKQRNNEALQAETGMASEALRKLRTNLRFTSLDDPPRSFVITSPNPGEGKSTVAANLARVLAEAGHQVVLIDADLRRPMQAAAFHLDSHLGLTQVLTGDVRLEDALQQSAQPNLRVLTAGRIPPNPSEVTGSQVMADIIQTLEIDNIVIIDAPPLLPVTDAAVLTAASDGALLVVRVGKTYKEQVHVAAKILEQVQGKLLGAVLNGATKKTMGEVVYGYGKGYGYGASYYTSYEGGGKRRGKKKATSQRPESAVSPVSVEPYSVSQPQATPTRARHG